MRLMKGLAPRNGRVRGFSGIFRVGLHCFRGATVFVRGLGVANTACVVRNCVRFNTYGSRGYLPPARISFSFSKGKITTTAADGAARPTGARATVARIPMTRATATAATASDTAATTLVNGSATIRSC